MSVPIIQQYKVGHYIIKQRAQGNRRYPLVLMLEPLFQCNLSCIGCGKIKYPPEILKRRMSVEECTDAVKECGVPIVSIAGGEPLLHEQISSIVDEIIRLKKFVYLCTNSLLLKKKMDLFTPSPYLTFSVHLDGDREHHDASVSRPGVFDIAVAAIKEARKRGFRVTTNCTLYSGMVASDVENFFDFVMDLGVEGITLSPGFNYEKASRHEMFLQRTASRNLFREIFNLAKHHKWKFNHTSMFLDFLAGNRSYECTPWGNPTRNIFGWQRPCYLLSDDGYANSFRELMETTDWEKWGPGRNEKCDNCMMHSGFEATAVNDMINHPIDALRLALFGPRTEGPMVPDVSTVNDNA